MGSSIGSLSGNQEMGNGDAGVHGGDTPTLSKSQPVPEDDQKTVLISLTESLEGSTKADGSGGQVKLKSRTSWKTDLKTVKDALEEMEKVEAQENEKSSLLTLSKNAPPTSAPQSAPEVEESQPSASALVSNTATDMGKTEFILSCREEEDYFYLEDVPLESRKGKSKNGKKKQGPMSRGRKKNKVRKPSPTRYFLRSKAVLSKTVESGEDPNCGEWSWSADLSICMTAEQMRRLNLTPGGSKVILRGDIVPPDPSALEEPRSPSRRSASRSSNKRKTSQPSGYGISAGIGKNRSKSRVTKPEKKILKAKRRKTGPQDLERQAKIRNYLRSKMLERGLGSPKFHGLPGTLWESITAFLSFPDLKRFRLVSPMTNAIVEDSLSWATNACFLLDGESESWKEARMSVCPPELICVDDTLGWPDVRFKNVREFSVETFWYSSDVRGSIRCLELKDCFLSWHEVDNLLNGLRNVEEFTFIFTQDFLYGHEMFTTLLAEGLDSKYDVPKELKSKKARKEAPSKVKEKSQSPSRIKKIFLSALNLELTNILLAVLTNIVRLGLQELRMFFAYDIFLNVPKMAENGIIKNTMQLLAKSIIDSNQKTLETIEISFTQITSTRSPQPEEYTTHCLTMPIICSIIKHGYQSLSLKKFIIEAPITVPIYSSKELSAINLEQGDYTNNLAALAVFCTAQPTLQFLRVSYLDLNVNHDIPMMLSKPAKNRRHIAKTCDFQMGAQLCCDENEFLTSNWGYLKTVLVDLIITYKLDSSQHFPESPYNQLFNSTLPVMKKVQRLDVRNWSTDLPNFKIPVITSKFPSLTRLIVGDARIRPDGLKNSPTVNDNDLQRIILGLPQLVELVIKCNMAELSDFGLTGIPKAACSRMTNENSFKRKAGDVIGGSLGNLKHLEVLELYGVGKGVTNVSAYLAFKDIQKLQELYLNSPNFSKMAKRWLQDRYRLRNGFKIIIN